MTSMGFTRYRIPEAYWGSFETAPILKGFQTEYRLVDLLRESKFYIMPSKYIGGITFHKKVILLHKDFKLFSEPKQLQILAHEGYHVAQQTPWGWISFMWKYLKEWIKADCSYQKMKTFGIEKAAYDYEYQFVQLL
jgi:hypothetical protein